MNQKLLIAALFFCMSAFGQTSEKYNSDYADFFRAEDLFLKEQYSAARKEFRSFIDTYNNQTDPLYVKANYYEAVSALELYNNDAIPLLEKFNENYPESIYKKDIYYRLGKFYYQKKKYKDVLAWFNKLSAQDLEPEDRDEFYFKLGYANFKLDDYDAARSAFHEVKDGDSQYAAPALYYYSHIEYDNKNYQAALVGFLKLENDEKFGKIVPYYIAQIYYLQGQYEEVTKYASKLHEKGGIANERDLNHLVGDAFYRTEKYDEAIPYLLKYNELSNVTREDNYRLGYAYYKTGAWAKAINTLDRVKRVEDSLGQAAYYHIAECLLKLNNKVSARSAFEDAAFIDADAVLQEDALFNYAILSYELDINPYDEAVEAFELYLSRYPESERREDVYQYLVNVYMSTNNYQKALASLDKLATKDIRLKTAYQIIAFNQGVKRFQQSNFTGAISSFDLVDKYPIDPEISAMALFWTADAYFRMKNNNSLDKAIVRYKEFILLPSAPANLKAEAHYNIGYAYLKKRELNLAIQSFRSFTQSNPTNAHKKADAFMRIADSYYVQKENDQAVKFYKEAVAVHDGYEDQALFYMGKTYGYMGKPEEKISALLDIVNNYKSSKYLQTSIFEIAKTYNGSGNLDQALKYFRIIVFDYPASVLVVESRLYIADIYFKQGNSNKAEDEYNAILDKYSSDGAICERASRGLIEIYIAKGSPEKAEELAARYPCANFSPDETEDLYYEPAMAKYSDSLYGPAIPLFEKYLEKFPSNGRYTSEVKNYLANCYYENGDMAKAIEMYMVTLEGPNTGFTELAAARVSHYLYSEGRYDEVIKYYKRLEEVSSKPEVIFNSQLGLMRSHYLIENWANAVVYAEKVLEAASLSNELKIEAHYAKGMSHYHLTNYDKAKSSLVWLMKNTTTVKAAEARYVMAEMFFKQGFLDQSDEEIDALLKQKPTYNYWVAKGLILRTRVKIAQDDLFTAEQTLKSVIDHYPVPDDGILDEANELWSELMQLKEEPEKRAPDTNNIIEIEEQGNDE